MLKIFAAFFGDDLILYLTQLMDREFAYFFLITSSK